MGFTHAALATPPRIYLWFESPRMRSIPQPGDVPIQPPTGNASKSGCIKYATRFRSRKTCRDTCHTEMGGQAQPPMGAGHVNSPQWRELLKLRKSKATSCNPNLHRMNDWGENLAVYYFACLLLTATKNPPSNPPKLTISVPISPVPCIT